jgi:hypothetical protein
MFYELHIMPYNNSRTAEWVYMTFRMDVMPVDANPNSLFLCSAVDNNIMMITQNHEVEQ